MSVQANTDFSTYLHTYIMATPIPDPPAQAYVHSDMLIGNDMRDIITHIATYASPNVGQRHVDYVFQYRWEVLFERGVTWVFAVLVNLDAVYQADGDEGVKLAHPKLYDDLRQGEGKLEALRYWRASRQSSV